MKNFYRSLFLALFVSSTVLASDTTSSIVITPGVIHTQYTKPGPYTLDVLEIDIKNPYLTLESYRPNGLTKTTVQSAANDRPNHRVIGAVNAGFFSFETGWPVYNQVANGIPVLGITANKSAIALTKEKRVLIDGFSFKGTFISAAGATLPINLSNGTRAAGQTVLFTSYKGASTGTDATGMEVSLKIVSDPLTVNDTLVAVVTAKGAGNLSIPSDGYVVSGGSGTPSTFLNGNTATGDTVKLYLEYALRSLTTVHGITQLISGYGRLIKDGVPYPTIGDYDGSGSGFNDVRHPRTFVGFNADTSKVYLCTVDGRQASSIGMTFTEMANFLLSLGVTNAFNLDGGGSTTMVVRGAVVNSPSDPGGERSVANSLQVISTAPVGTLHTLNILESAADVFQGRTYQFHAAGMDEYLNPLPLPGGTVWSCDSSIGSIDSAGLFSAKTTNDTGWVRITYADIADSVLVHVRVIKELKAYPPVLVMVPGERLTFSIRGIDSGDNTAELSNDQVTFQVGGSGMNVEPNGVVTATGFGTGTITVTIDTVSVAVPFSSIGNDTTAVVERFNDVHFWTWDVQNTDPDNVFFALSGDPVVPFPPAFRIKFAAPPLSVVRMNTSLPVSGRPDSIRIAVYGDGGGHTAQLTVRDKDGEEFVIPATAPVTWNDQWNDLVFRMVSASPVAGGTIDYPITIDHLQFTVGNANLVSGSSTDTIYVDNIVVHYPNRKVAPQVLYDFNTSVSGWQQPSQNSTAQTIGINIPASTLVLSHDHPYEGAGCGKWTFVDDPAKTVDWDVRITRTTSAELGSMLRGSYIGAWVWADGKMDITLRTVIRDGNGQLCQGPAFPVNHVGWKLIGTRLDGNLFTPYLTDGKITDVNNRFNGFRLQAKNADVDGKTKVFYIDKMVTSALTVPSGFLDFGATYDSTADEVTVSWGVNSEISINRYEVEKSTDGANFTVIGSVNAVGNSDTTQRYSFTDPEGVTASVQYRIVQITNDGSYEYSPAINFIITETGEQLVSPWTYELQQNFPNPFNPSTSIPFSIAERGTVKLSIYDVLGREVDTVVNGVLEPGRYSTHWNATNCSSGVYFYRLETEHFVKARKMVVMK